MAIEHRITEGRSTGHVVTTSCPFCDESLNEFESLAKHLRYSCPENGGEAGV